VLFVSRLLVAERRRRGTRSRRRALGCYRQAVLVLRWFVDGTRLAQLAADNRIGRSTAYRYLHEGLDVLAAAAPGLRGALLKINPGYPSDRTKQNGAVARVRRVSWERLRLRPKAAGRRTIPRRRKQGAPQGRVKVGEVAI
jgi:hypothetical protein